MDERTHARYMSDIAYFLSKMEAEPNSGYFIPIALAYNKLEKYDETIAMCKSAIERFPANCAAKTFLAEAYVYKGQFDLARELLFDVTAEDDNNYKALKLLGIICKENGDTTDALKYLTGAYIRSPEDEEVKKMIEELGGSLNPAQIYDERMKRQTQAALDSEEDEELRTYQEIDQRIRNAEIIMADLVSDTTISARDYSKEEDFYSDDPNDFMPLITPHTEDEEEDFSDDPNDFLPIINQNHSEEEGEDLTENLSTEESAAQTENIEDTAEMAEDESSSEDDLFSALSEDNSNSEDDLLSALSEDNSSSEDDLFSALSEDNSNSEDDLLSALSEDNSSSEDDLLSALSEDNSNNEDDLLSTLSEEENADELFDEIKAEETQENIAIEDDIEENIEDIAEDKEIEESKEIEETQENIEEENNIEEAVENVVEENEAQDELEQEIIEEDTQEQNLEEEIEHAEEEHIEELAEQEEQEEVEQSEEEKEKTAQEKEAEEMYKKTIPSSVINMTYDDMIDDDFQYGSIVDENYSEADGPNIDLGESAPFTQGDIMDEILDAVGMTQEDMANDEKIELSEKERKLERLEQFLEKVRHSKEKL